MIYQVSTYPRHFYAMYSIYCINMYQPHRQFYIYDVSGTQHFLYIRNISFKEQFYMNIKWPQFMYSRYPLVMFPVCNIFYIQGPSHLKNNHTSPRTPRRSSSVGRRVVDCLRAILVAGKRQDTTCSSVPLIKS